MPKFKVGIHEFDSEEDYNNWKKNNDEEYLRAIGVLTTPTLIKKSIIPPVATDEEVDQIVDEAIKSTENTSDDTPTDESISTESQDNLDTDKEENTKIDDSQEDTSKKYSEVELWEMTKAQLSSILDEMEKPSKGNKEQLIKLILEG